MIHGRTSGQLQTGSSNCVLDNARARVETFARVQTDGIHFCPRCGRMTIKEKLHTNALSRYAEVYICDACGTDEALRDYVLDPLPLTEWAIASLPETSLRE